MINLNEIIASISGMSEVQREYYKKTHENSLSKDALETLKKGKEFVDEAIKIEDINEQEMLVKLLVIYIFLKQSNHKTK